MANNPRVLLIMHDVPLSSGFLAAKFLKLAEKMDTFLLVWDNKKNIQKFIRKNKIDKHLSHRIYSGVKSANDLFAQLFSLLFIILSCKKVAEYFFKEKGSFTSKIKFVALYLPVFKIKPDIIHFEFGTLARHVALLKQLTDAKMVVSFRGYDINYIGLDTPGYYNDVWQNIDAIHFLGEDLKKRALHRGYKGDKLEAIIAPAIDVAFFIPKAATVIKNQLRIISVGRLVWKKGYDLAIRTMAELKKRNVPFEYSIIGGGEQLQALQFIRAELGLDNEVKILGDKLPGEIKEALNEANIFLHPAISEGFCNAVLEAQAMRLPVVCSDADGLPENIVNNVTGFVVPKWDVQVMADKIEWFWNNKKMIGEMGSAGMKRVNESFRIEDQINKFERFYKDIYEKRY
jgi:colanic acid/amylovoran biosynthesis glycosyltransferase